MDQVRNQGTLVGSLGIICLAIYATGRFAPAIVDTFAFSPFGKIAFVSTLPASVVLATIAAIRGSKWWLIIAAAGAIALADLYTHLSRVTR
jgi:hypothetical protein